MKIKLLPYESCLEIGTRYFDKERETSAVLGLPEDVFDKTFEVCDEMTEENYYIAPFISRAGLKLQWVIPPIFVSYVSQ